MYQNIFYISLYFPIPGAIWPKPKEQTTYTTFSVIRPSVFSFEPVNHTCDILTQAFVRYRKIIGTLTTRKLKARLSTVNDREGKKNKKSWRSDPQFEGNLEVVHVNLKNPCETKPYLGMDESCKYIKDKKFQKIYFDIKFQIYYP